MSETTLQALDLTKYLHLLQSLMPAVENLFLVDPDGRLSSSCGAAGGGAEALARLPKEEWRRHDDHCRSHEWHGGIALAREVLSELGELLGTLVVRLKVSRGEQLGELLERMRPALAKVAACVSGEYQLLNDVQSLTGELIDRYEELNLVYKTAREDSALDGCGDALEQLVRSCCDHLDTDFVALIVPDKGIQLHAGNPANPVSNPHQVVKRLAGPVFEHLVAERSTVIVNGDSVAHEGWRELPLKLLACPLADGEQPAIGLLALVNHAERPDFTNGDRNLLSVMAGKATKILLASHDTLTGLMTRRSFEYLLAASLALARRKRQASCVLYVNIDQLHVVNDTLGRQVGDELIRQIAVLLRSELRQNDAVARLGGDDFGVLLQGAAPDRARHVAEKLRGLIANTTFWIEDERLSASVSVGISSLDEATETIISALAAAEVACAVAQDMGRNRVKVYQADDLKLTQRKEQMHWVSRLQEALREDQFVLYGQKIAPLRPDLGADHVEVLVRLPADEGVLLRPASFIPAAERYHLMVALDRWVVHNTLTLLTEHCTASTMPELVSINLSGQSLSESGFLEYAVEQLRQFALPLERICFEITETAAIANIEEARRFMSTLKEHGCRFALDDFGAGLSSFAYLKSLPVDYLKIDGCFVREIIQDRASQSIVAAINHVGHSLRLATVAEYVESEDIRRKLQDLGVDYAQGDGVETPRPLLSHLGADLSPGVLARDSRWGGQPTAMGREA